MSDVAPIPRTAPTWPRFLWHHDVHIHRGERLIFIRLLFAPVYERDQVEAALRTVCAEHGVLSFIGYELFGEHDSLLRAWLPAGVAPVTFHRALALGLGKAGLELAEPFEVDHIVRHWAFVDDSGDQERPLRPSRAAIESLSEEEIAEVDENFPEVRDTLSRRLRDEHLLAPFGGWDTDFDRDRPGIKFAVVVSSGPEVELSVEELGSFEEAIAELLTRARGVGYRSLYKGSGIGHFLIMGRVAYLNFHAIHSQIIARINAASFRERYNACTTTHISGQRGFHIAEEALTRGPSPAPAVVRSLPALPAAQLAPVGELAPGTVYYDRFEILEPLGSGGFATVYRAFDNYEQVERALKVFKSPDPAAARREVLALHRAREHPNIVKLYWAGQAGEQNFLVFEFVDGSPLHHVSGLDPLRVIDIVIQVLDALITVHPNDARIDELRAKGTLTSDEFAEYGELLERGLVHRDIKPDNIMLDREGIVRLVDFNIASPAYERKITRSGTPPYQAPDAGEEYWEPSDDLFACGVVLYELLCLGNHPWERSQPLAHIPPIDPRKWRPELSESLSDVVMRACAPRRSDRYATATELKEDLVRELEALERVEQAHESRAHRLGRLVHKRRTDRGISQKDLASEVGLPVEEIARIERGESIPSASNAAKIAHMLELKLLEGPELDFAD